MCHRHISPNISHSLTESGAFTLSKSVMSILVTGKSRVLGLFIFIGLYLALLNYLALILPGAPIHGLVCLTRLSHLSDHPYMLGFCVSGWGKVSPSCSMG